MFAQKLNSAARECSSIRKLRFTDTDIERKNACSLLVLMQATGEFIFVQQEGRISRHPLSASWNAHAMFSKGNA